VANIKPYYSRVKPQTGGGRPLYVPEWMGQEQRAAAQFGKAAATGLGGLGEKYLDARIDSQFTVGKAAWQRGHNEFLRDIRDDDYDIIIGKYKKFETGLRKGVLAGAKIPGAKRALGDLFQQTAPGYEKVVDDTAWRKEVDKMRAGVYAAVADFERAGNSPAASAALMRAEKAGYLSAVEAQARMGAIESNVEWNAGIHLAENNPEWLLESMQNTDKYKAMMASLGFDTKDEEPFKDLDTPAKEQLKRKARTRINQILAQQKGQRAVEINAEQGRLMNLLRTNQLTDAIIREANLDEFGTGSRKSFYDLLDNKAQADLSGKNLRFTTSDGDVLAATLDKVRDPESDIIEKDISGLVGKGLSVNDGDRLIARLDVYKSFWFGRADTYLKNQLGWSGVEVRFMHPAGALSYHLAMDKVFAAIEEENLKEKDVYERAKLIAIPYVVDYWEKVLMLKEPELEHLTGLLRGESTAISEPKRKTGLKTKKSEKKIGTIDPEGIW